MSFRRSLQNKDFLAFWLAQLISQFGDRINQMALVGLVTGRQMAVNPGSAMELAKLLAFTIIPVFVVGPIAGVYVDRWDRKTTMFVCDILRGLLVLTIPLIFFYQNSMWPIYGVVFLAFCLSRFYVPAKMSIIPEIVDPDSLHAANSLATVTGMIAFVLGALLGGLIVEYWGARGGFLIDACTFLVSALLISLISRPQLRGLRARELFAAGKEMASAYKNVWHEARDGVAYIVANRDIRYIINLMMVLFMAAGAIYVVIIIFIQEAFGSVTKHLGFMAVGLGAGLLLGSIAYGKWGDKKKHVETIFSCLIAGGVVLAVFAFAVQAFRNIWVAQGLALVLGFVVGPVVIAANTVVHKVASPEMQGKVFSAMEFAIHFAFLSTMLLSSKLSEFIPRAWILMAVGGVFFLVGIVGIWKYQRSISLGERSAVGVQQEVVK
ncbi:MAG: MFS transporter [Candidatus Omnitrophica bacterium]|nr:MFS transporter [Candidatus Omnitrophota bacterium]